MKHVELLVAAALAALSPGAFAGGGHGDGHAHRHADHHGGATAAREQTGWGIAADPKAAARVVRITMHDTMRFSPETIRVQRGETVKFVVHNAGQMQHEIVLGTPEALQEHARLMRKFPGMQHEEAHMAHVAPGGTETLAWTFNRAGEFQFACLVAGHYEAGMQGGIRVVGREPEAASGPGAPAPYAKP